jgi:hypothetical protein
MVPKWQRRSATGPGSAPRASRSRPTVRVVDERDRGRHSNFRTADHAAGEALLHVIGERRRVHGCHRRFDAYPISRRGTSQRRAGSRRLSSRERGICGQKLRRAIDISPRLGRITAVRTFTMVFAPGPLAPISPQASPADAVKNDMDDGPCIAEVACKPLEQDRGRGHARLALHAHTLKPAIGGRVGAAQPVIGPESAGGIGGDGVGQPPLGSSQSGHSRDTPFGRLTREETIQMSLDSATISGVGRFMIPHTRS